MNMCDHAPASVSMSSHFPSGRRSSPRSSSAAFTRCPHASVDIDDDTSAQIAYVNAYSATSSDLTGKAESIIRGLYTSGVDCAVQADNGYVRIGTGSTPGVTPGDDDLFVEGTAEVDGSLYPDGGIIGAGTAATTIRGMTSVTEQYIAANNVLTIDESGSTYHNTTDADGSLHTLPEASTCIGAEFTFVVVAGQTITVNPDDADIFLHLTLDAGDAISSSTANDTITVRAISASQWAVISVYPLAADWADAS